MLLRAVFILCLCLLVCSPASLFAQTGRSGADSLLVQARAAYSQGQLAGALYAYLQVLRLYEREETATQRAEVLEEVGKVYAEGGLYEKALEYYEQAIRLPRTPSSMAHLQEQKAKILGKLRRHPEAIVLYDQALQYRRTHGHTKDVMRLLQAIVSAHQALGQQQEALKRNAELLLFCRSIGNKREEFVALNNMGYIQKYLKDYVGALLSFTQAFALQRQDEADDREALPLMVNLGIINQNMGDYQSALGYLNDALVMVQTLRDTSAISQVCDLIAMVQLQRRDTYNALLYNDRSLETARAVSDRHALQNALKTRSLILQEEDDYQEALRYYQMYLNLRDSLAFEERVRQQELNQQKAFAERTERDIRLLMVNEEVKDLEMKRLAQEADARRQELTLARQTAALQMAELEKKELQEKQARQALLLARQEAQTAEAEKQRLLLEQANREQELLIARQKLDDEQKEQAIRELEQTKKLQDLENAKQRETLMYLYGLVALGILVLALFVYGFLRIRRTNHQLEQQKEEISQKNIELVQTQEEIAAQRDTLAKNAVELNRAYENITASITYAKRIQSAILPELSAIEAVFPQSFVFYKPRDIVSGDFYYFVHDPERRRTLIAAADCTGHGVPGAFMSVIGNDALSYIIETTQQWHPDRILAELHELIFAYLKQSTSDSRDGMDIAICVWDQDKQVVQYAGAMNPLYYVQAGQLHEIKADKMPIGGRRHKENTYTLHTIPLSTEDGEPIPTVLYLCSDGFQDQFGGQKGRKFMVAKLRELLHELHALPAATQQQRLQQTLTDWMGREEQVDDILVIGLKIGEA